MVELQKVRLPMYAFREKSDDLADWMPWDELFMAYLLRMYGFPGI